jgi:hypothetical protein
MLKNPSSIDLVEKCLGEIGRSLLFLSHEVGHGECSFSSYQIVADIETKIDEVSNHIKSPGMPADYVLYVKRVLSPIKKELAQLNDYNTSLEELAPKLEPNGATLYENCFEQDDPPTSFPGISRELQKLKDLIEVYDPNSALAMPMAKWIGFGVLLLAQNNNDILSAQEHSEIQNRAYAIVTFLNTIKSRSKKKSLRYIDETIRFLKVQEEYANVNRPTSQSLDALEEFNLFVDELCGCIVNSLYRSDDWPWSYSLDEIMSLSKGVGETLYSGQSLFCDKNKHEVEQAFRKSVEILADATKSEFWDDFADLTKALCVIGECSETLQEAELSLCRLCPGRVALADRGGSGNSPLDSDARKKDDNPEPPAGDNMDKRVKAELPGVPVKVKFHIELNKLSSTACDNFLLDLWNEYRARSGEAKGIKLNKKQHGDRAAEYLRGKLDRNGYTEVAQAIQKRRVKVKKAKKKELRYYLNFNPGEFLLSTRD